MSDIGEETIGKGSFRMKKVRENASIMDMYKQWKQEKEEEIFDEEIVELSNITKVKKGLIFCEFNFFKLKKKKSSIEQFYENYWKHINERHERQRFYKVFYYFFS